MASASAALSRWRRLSEAVAFTLTVHAHQTRKGTGIPYISHLLAVASLVLEYGGDEEQAIAGLLHDAIEDQGVHLEPIIQEKFGPRVARIVRACSEDVSTPKPPWRARKEAYIAHLSEVDPDALLVSCADKLHNVRSICTDLRTVGLALYTRFTCGRHGTLWYYTTLADVFAGLLPGPLSGELKEAVKEMQRLTRALDSGALEAAAPSTAPVFADIVGSR